MFIDKHRFGTNCFSSFYSSCKNLLLLALHNCSAHMGRGGFVYCTASRQINSSPTQPSLIIAEQKMCVYSYPSARPGTLWTGIKAEGMGRLDGRKGEQKAGSSSLKKKESKEKMHGLI